MFQKSAEIEVLELWNSHVFFAPYHLGSKLKEVSKPYLHVHFCLHFAISASLEACSTALVAEANYDPVKQKSWAVSSNIEQS